MRRVMPYAAFTALTLGLVIGTAGTGVGQDGTTGYDDAEVLGVEETVPEGTEVFTVDLTEDSDGGLDGDVPPGSFLDLIVGGFDPNSKGTVEITSERRTLAFVTADGDGVITHRVQIPVDLELGEHTLHVVGVDPNGDPLDVTVKLTVAFPSEGSDWPTWTPGAIAVALVAITVASWWQMRRRSEDDRIDDNVGAMS